MQNQSSDYKERLDAQRRKQSEKMKLRWMDPEYRERMFAKQQDIGMRAYGTPLNIFKKKYNEKRPKPLFASTIN